MCECMYHYTVQEEQLRVALMDYLQTHHPNDHEKMQMVALKFGMIYVLAITTDRSRPRETSGESNQNTSVHYLPTSISRLSGYILYDREM